jgi:hypothetical protein
MYHKELDVRMWTGLIWLKMMSNAVLCEHSCKYLFPKKAISYLTSSAVIGTVFIEYPVPPNKPRTTFFIQQKIYNILKLKKILK